MSIFGRDESTIPEPVVEPVGSSPRPAQPKPAARITQISPGTRIQGEITGTSEVQIDGRLDGRVHVEGAVRVEANGQVKGEIQAQSISVAGRVVGNIVGGEMVDIRSSGKLQGDVKAPRVSIADGAYFKGRVEMTGETPVKEKPAPKQAKQDSRPKAAVPAQSKIDPVAMDKVSK